MDFLKRTRKSSSNLFRRFSTASIDSLSSRSNRRNSATDCPPPPPTSINNSSRFTEPEDRPPSPLYYTKQVYATAEPPITTTTTTTTEISPPPPPLPTSSSSSASSSSVDSSLVDQVKSLQIATQVVPQVDMKPVDTVQSQTETTEAGPNSSEDINPTVPSTTVQTDVSAKKARAAAAHAAKSSGIRASQATTPEDFIQVAIQYHEQNRLEESLMFFRMDAEQNSPIGMFLYGISLRHGWGCEPNEQLAFQYLQKAAESAVFDLNNFDSVNTSAARHELVLAIYELGVSFRHGWGVPKNKVTAAYYFEIAANLGDPDAQNDLGWCLEHGMGIKKDTKKAAYYYRKAASQGHEVLGNSWIWKPKYDPPCA